ncbi:hypothetical protein PROAA_1350007 [Candidatus Propionivibrio aalborgensis]|uniref:Uncharacterized protein n=1 Tax=Candidatus Propionivibrio aalborgensis TaxID=1860101 RepID=A0A1A8XK22_9RHOO|nr:hypothetical protein PROAA_1350007 [Candidatus Propionivibrio aalborgensis]
MRGCPRLAAGAVRIEGNYILLPHVGFDSGGRQSVLVTTLCQALKAVTLPSELWWLHSWPDWATM